MNPSPAARAAPKRNPLQKRAPDPARAHGAWVYLVVSILGGVLSTGAQGWQPALCTGVGFVGVFLIASALAIYPHAWRRRFAVGAAITGAAAVAGLVATPDPTFLAYASIGLFPASAAVWFASRGGFLSPPALTFGVITLVVSAPAAACAGGQSPLLGLVLFGLLAPFFAWRTWRVRSWMTRQQGVARAELRRAGLREAGLALGWTVVAVGAIHALARLVHPM